MIKIFTSYPLIEYYTQQLNGTLKYIDQLEHTNTLALLGGGENPKYNENKVVIWENFKFGLIKELHLEGNVLSVKLHKNYIFVVQ